MAATITFSFTVNVEAPDVMQITLNGSTDPLSVSLPAVNAGGHVADVGVVTHSGAAYAGQLALGGADAGKFVLTNGGTLPCALSVGATDITTGAYAIDISAP